MPVGQIARRTFAHRSIRVIALSRLAIAVLFGVWVRIDPMQPVRYPDAGLLLFEGYVLYSLALLLIAWRNWWLDFRLSGLAYLGDCLIFLTALFFTQSRETDLISPFTTFFVYLVLAAVLRWQGRHALSATLALAAAFTLTGFGMAFHGIDIDTMNFVRRASFMGVLAILLTWFARERGIGNAPRFHPMAEHEEPDMMEQALQYAMRNMDASGAALRWARLEEPGITLAGAGLLRDSSGLFPPFLSNPDENAVPVLFDLRRDRAIGYYEGRMTLFDDCGEVPVLLNALGISEGLSLPLAGSMGCGELVLVGIEGMCVDHVLFGRHIAREITRILDEEENRAAARDRELMQERSSIARDLQDSVVQSLAGAQFRLAALVRARRETPDLAAELDDICESLSAEQGHVRTVIDRLRTRGQASGQSDLSAEIPALAKLLSLHWGIAVRLVEPGDAIIVSTLLLHEVQQLLREAVANAARQGDARAVEIEMAVRSDNLILVICDDGMGFPDTGPDMPPSLSGRVSALGGELSLASQRGYSRLEIVLPVPSASQ